MSTINYLSAVFHDGVVKRFTGRDAISLVKGNSYNIMVRQSWFGRIIVDPCHGYEWRPYVDMTMVYPDLHHFLHDWEPKTLHHPLNNL